MSCEHLPKPSWAWTKCIVGAQPGDAGIDSISYAQRILSDVEEVDLKERPQIFLYLFQALYYDDKQFEKIIKIGFHLDELITADTPLHKEILAQCTMLYIRALDKRLGRSRNVF